MITKEALKAEIDNIEDEYLEILYRIIKVFESPMQRISDGIDTINSAGVDKELEWREFIKETYGSLAEAPIERGDQGKYEVREEIG